MLKSFDDEKVKLRGKVVFYSYEIIYESADVVEVMMEKVG